MNGASKTPRPDDPFRARAQVLNLEGGARQVLDQARTRLVVVGAVFALSLTAVAVRLGDLAFLTQPEPRAALAAVQPFKAERGDITDRNGMLLATSLATASLFADPAKVLDPQETAKRLAQALPELSYGDVLQKLESGGRFVWLRRNLTPRQQAAVHNLGLPGLDFRREERRIYPAGAVTSHVVGFTDVDNHGLAGIEQSFDKMLGKSEPVRLSIDLRLQHMLRREIQQQIAEFNALGGGGMIMDVRTGELLALVSLPDFDPQSPGTGDAANRFNRMTLGVYEMGSTFKVFNTALALESGRVRMDDWVDATKPIKVGRFTIDDFRTERLRRWMSVPEVFTFSSNIGSVREVQQVGPAAQQRFLTSLGLTEKPTLEIPEVGKPHVPNPWREINMMTIAFGHGLSTTPVNNVTAFTAIVNNGVLKHATLIAQPDDAQNPGVRVLSAATSENVRRLLRLNAIIGSGKNANVPGYLVGGKTGTAEKAGGGKGYSKSGNLSSFIATFPINEPRYVVFVLIDEPHGNKKSYGFSTGAWVSAPAVGRVIAQMGPLYGIAPIDENEPSLQRALYVNSTPPGRRLGSETYVDATLKQPADDKKAPGKSDTKATAKLVAAPAPAGAALLHKAKETRRAAD
ncbi:MAG: penicillin-binding protein [Rhodospirillales bacterium]|nr:penicillin-binding protein [Rhodospirillales bacterium]